jgi:pimeloyl-ACP methyl ester carboxylesterase
VCMLCLSGYSQQHLGLRYFGQSMAVKQGSISYGNNPKAGHYVLAGDARIYYELYGKGQPLLLLHGGMLGSTIEMARLIDSFSRNFLVIAVSTRGHGKSELGTTLFSYKQRAQDALAVVKAVTKDSVVLFGFSDGGYTGYAFAAMYPASVKKMIIIGAAERHPGDTKLRLTVEDARRMDSNYIDQQFALMPEPRRMQEMFTTVSDYFNDSLTVDKTLLDLIKCPVLVMAGYHDQFLPAERVVNAVRMIAYSELAIIPGASHTVFLDNFPAVWTTIVPFIKEQH